MSAPSDPVAPRRFLPSNGEKVLYTPTKDERNLNFTGKKLNWITEYWHAEKLFPRIVRELKSGEDVPPPPGPAADESTTTAPCTVKGSTRAGLYVPADEGKPPPTNEQRNPFYTDLSTAREFVLDCGERVLFASGVTYMQYMDRDSDLVGNKVAFDSISGGRTTPRIVRELGGAEKSSMVSKDGPTENDPPIPYILHGVPTRFLYTTPYIFPDAMAEADAKRNAAGDAETERFYAATSKHPAISTCREFLLYNGHRDF